jgi:hypothetical protein
MVMEKGGWAISQAEVDAVTFPLWVAGRYYSQPGVVTFGTANTAGYVHELTAALPIFVPGPNGSAIDELGMEIFTTGTAGGLIRLGIYDDFEGQPWDLILDAGTIDIGYSGWQHVDVALRLRGWAWLAAVLDDAAVFANFYGATTNLNTNGRIRLEDTTARAGFMVSGARELQQVGLPARFPLRGDYSASLSSDYVPRLMVRAA